jgi:hypothetical protein
MPDETLEVILDVVSRLETLGIPYVIGGSFASSTHGEYRASGDVDLLIELPAARVDEVVRALQGEYYVSIERAAGPRGAGGGARSRGDGLNLLSHLACSAPAG